jgi:hypothetical protein
MAIYNRFYNVIWLPNKRVVATCRLCGKTINILKHKDCQHGKEIHEILVKDEKSRLKQEVFNKFYRRK